MGAVRLRNATLVVAPAELCSRHGVGVLLLKIFADEPALVALYSRRLFDGRSAGDVALHLPYPDESARPRLAGVLEPHQIRRIFCVPHVPDDARTAIAASELTGAPLVTYVLDDQNLFIDGIPDALMRDLIERSALCLAGSSVLQAGYEAKFGRPFGLLPPVNESRLFASPDLPAPNNQPPRGVIIGNVWSARVLEELRLLIRTAGLPVEWFGNAGAPFIEIDPAELRADGIELHPNLADEPLVERLRGFDYGIMPSGRLDEDPELDWLFRASLPSRLIYMLTSAHLPLVVLGDPETTAAEFVTGQGLGVTCDYEPAAFTAAVRQVTDPVAGGEIRERAARLSPSFASEPVAEWVWRSAEAGRPVDDRYAALAKDDRRAAKEV
jgi:hypothetical protein